MEETERRIEDHEWGYVDIICPNGKILYVDKRGRSSTHYDELRDKTFYIHNGIVLLEFFELENNRPKLTEEMLMSNPDPKKIPNKRIHRFTALTDNVEIIEFSSHNNGRKIIVGDKEGGEMLSREEFNKLINKYSKQIKAYD